MSLVAKAVIVMAVMGWLFAFLLGIAAKLTYVPVDPKIQKVRAALPGANCGACGYPGCDGCAEAIVKGEAPHSACPVGGEKSLNAINEILGGGGGANQRMVASVKCQGDLDKTSNLFEYDGVGDCRVMTTSYGGCKSCSYGCLGCGSCRDACNYDAIEIVNGVAVINQERCVSCGACIKVCPKDIIELVPYHAPAQVKCSNPLFGKEVKSNCKVGCIGCGICHRLAPDEFALDGKLAHATYHEGYDLEKAQKAADKCPGKCIVMEEYPDVNAIDPKAEEKEEAVEA